MTLEHSNTEPKPTVTPEILSLAASLGIGTSPHEPENNGQDFFYTDTRVVKKVPRSYYDDQNNGSKADGKKVGAGFLDGLKRAFASPAVEKHKEMPRREGKFYHVNENGQIIETKVTRAGLYQGWNGQGGDIRRQV